MLIDNVKSGKKIKKETKVKKGTPVKLDPQLVKIMNDINKKFGTNAVRIGSEMLEETEFDRIPTGSIELDICLGGGIPVGRYSQIEGAYSSTKTTQTGHIVGRAQKKGLVCAWFDAEGTTDKVYLQSLGVDTDQLLFVRPDGMEECTQMIIEMQRSGAVHLAVIDSLEALTPIKEYDKDFDETMQMGIKPKMFGEFFRKYQASNNKLARENKRAFTLIGINQLRERIGCLHADTKISFTDGRSYTIKEVVENRIEGEVFSLNEQTQEIESKKITDYHYNGDIEEREEYISINFYCPENKNGKGNITVTENHRVMTQEGWKRADELKEEDMLVSTYTNKINGEVKQFLLGAMLGDTSIKTEKYVSAFRYKDNVNPDYVQWKIDKMPTIKFKSYKYGVYESEFSTDLYELSSIIGEKRNPLEVVRDKDFTVLSLAIWYFDDGNYRHDNCSSRISITRFADNRELLEEVAGELNSKFEMDIKVCTQGTLRFNKDDTDKLHRLISKYTPKTMQYKLKKEYRDKYVEFSLENKEEKKQILVDINDISVCSKRKYQKKGKYDITVEDNHNYIAGGKYNGALVHNSYGNPEYSPGGRAKDFASSLNIRLRGGDWLAQGKGESKEIVGQIIKFRIDKNKTYKRMQDGEFDFYFAENENEIEVGHNDNFKSIIVQGVAWGLIERGGAWYYLDREKDLKFQGLDRLVEYLRENEHLVEEMKTQILKLADDVK